MFVLLIRAKCLAELNNIFDQASFTFRPFEIEEKEKMTMEKINSNHNSGQEKNTLEEFAPFGCVLDKNFVDLNFRTPVKAFDSFSTLLGIIAEGSPQLEKLSITCKITVDYKSFDNSSVEPGRITSLDIRFSCLTSLYVDYSGSSLFSLNRSNATNQANPPVLSIIVKYCPALIKLNVFLGFCMTEKHLLELILDEKWSDFLFPADNTRWNQDSVVLEGLQVPSQLLNPLCLTLQELGLCTCAFKPTCHRLSEASVYAFALRQFPKLRKIELLDDKSFVDIIKILNKAKETDHQQQQTDFERDIRDAAIQIGIEENLITSPAPFDGKLLCFM